MEAYAVTEGVCQAIRSKQYDHIRNLANGDMVGRTGNLMQLSLLLKSLMSASEKSNRCQ